MGTNYYLQTNVCPTCKKAESERHIGKSSGGWCFALHVYPEDNIHDLEDWKRLMEAPGAKIKDEYGKSVVLEDMFRIITERRNFTGKGIPFGYASRDQFDLLNHAERGPHGLSRHKIEPGHCIKHGAGTWDYIIGDFS